MLRLAAPVVAAEMGWVSVMCEAVARFAPLLARGDDSTFQNKVHLALSPG